MADKVKDPVCGMDILPLRYRIELRCGCAKIRSECIEELATYFENGKVNILCRVRCFEIKQEKGGALKKRGKRAW
jgi:hypothetical protein